MGFYDYAVPFFLLVFLILCFFAFLLARERMVVQPKATPREKPKPIPRETQKPKTKEGFQTTSGSWITNYGTSGTGRTPASGTGVTLPATGQFDMPAQLQALYGSWEITPQDSYYDDYEQNELAAVAIQSSKFTPIKPAPSTPTIFGSTLGAFDTQTIKIPWDNDNSSSEQKDIVWGFVSEQASRSIFLKTYVNEIAANMSRLQPCSPDDPTNFCYPSPLFEVSTRDSTVARLLQTSEALVQGAAMLPMMVFSSVNMNLSNISEVASAWHQTISRSFGLNTSAAHTINDIETRQTKVGDALKLPVGQRPLQATLAAQRPAMSAALSQIAAKTAATAAEKQGIIMGSVTGAAVAAQAGIAAGAALAPATLGASSAFAIAGSVAAGVLTGIALALDIFFGVIGGICMAIQAFVDPIITAMFETGGVCPDGYKTMSELLPGSALTWVANLVPMGSFLQSFDPYVCWAKDANGIANVRLKIPPKSPAFMSDRTLSLVYNATWISGQSGNIPTPSQLDIELDPLPNGYVWLNESDLKNTTNAQALITWATNFAGSSATATSYRGGSGGSGIPNYIAVQTCEANTTPSADGKECVQNRVQTESKLPQIGCPKGQTCPTGKLCPAGQTDDGYNCWTGAISPNCTNPQFQYTTTTTWDDKYGYFSPITSGCATDPGIAFAAKDRIVCDAGYENNTFGNTGELLCYRSCPAGQTRVGALCLGATQTHQRKYMFGSHTMYRTQAYDVKILKSLADVKIPYCDFASKAMLDKMGQFYYSQGLLNPQMNEDGTITVQIITKFFGVIASSELSCDVVCAIEFITYDPITGSNYSATTGCSASYAEDPMFKACPFCYRRFYFIRGDSDPQGEFTVTGCTNTDYTAPEAMVKSGDLNTNPVPSISDTPQFPTDLPARGSSSAPYTGTMKYWSVINKGDANIINMSRFQDAWASGRIMQQAGVGLLQAGISIAGGLLSIAGGAGAGILAARSAITKGASSLGLQAAARGARPEAVRAAAKEAAEKSASVIAAIQSSTARNVVSGADEAAQTAATAAIQQDAMAAARTAGIRGNYTSGMSAAEREAADELAQRAFVSQAMGNMRWPIAEAGGMAVAGLVGATAAGLFNTMWLDGACREAMNGGILPAQVPMVTVTTIVGKDPYNLSVAINQNWWVANQGRIYELAPGYSPNIKFCQLTSTGAMVPVSSAYCTNKFILRNMVNIYHNTYQNAHIRQIKQIEARGTTGCYYKWDEVAYNPNTNIEGTVVTEKEMMLTNTMKDLATCTYLPTALLPVDLVAYPIRSYIDPSTAGTATPRTIYPTRSLNFTSDLYARYVRVVAGPAGGSAMSGSSTVTNDGYLNLVQLSVFDVSGFNVSTQAKTYSTSLYTGAATADTVVNGTGSTGTTLDTVFQPNTADQTEYWEVDLGKIINISELVYVGGSINLGRNYGVKIHFLYTNGVNDAPIYTYTLPSVEAVQSVNLASSSFDTPMFPLAGPVQIPRPLKAGVILHSDQGCINRCEDRGVIDSLVKQYNDTKTDSSIMKVLQGVTSSKSTCEYQVEILTSDIPAGADTPPKNSLTKQTLSMEVNLAPTAVQQTGLIKARYLKVIPSGTPGTILEFSKILVRTGTLTATGKLNPTTYISAMGVVNQYNMMYQLEEIAINNGGNTYLQRLLLAPSSGSGTPQPQSYPNIFRAAENDPQTFFVVDFGPSMAGGSGLKNQYIYDITFVGVSENSPPPVGRTRGGLAGVQLVLYSDVGAVDQTAFDGTYDPVYRYVLPTDAVSPAPILVSQPPKCSFTLGSTTVLSAPDFLQLGTPPLSAVDTSGGVFSFSSLVNSLGSAWSALQPLNSTDLATPIRPNVPQSDLIVHKMLENVSANQTILNTGVRCSDPGSLARMMTAYNIAKAPKSTEQFGVTKHTMRRILKAGQSTLKTCDVLFEDQEDNYDDYIQDTSGTDITKSIKASRFTFKTFTGSTAAIPDVSVPIIFDLSSNALGIMSDSSALRTVYGGPYANVNCRDSALLQLVKQAVTPEPKTEPLYTKQMKFVSVKESFQSTPLTCEYTMAKVQVLTSTKRATTVTSNQMDTYVKAEFTLGDDGYSISFASAKEYDPLLMTLSADKLTVYLPGPTGPEEVDLPSIFSYTPKDVVSKRVNSQVQNI